MYYIYAKSKYITCEYMKVNPKGDILTTEIKYLDQKLIAPLKMKEK